MPFECMIIHFQTPPDIKNAKKETNVRRIKKIMYYLHLKKI